MFYVIRHSERLDDIDPTSWEEQIRQLYDNSKNFHRKRIYFSADPPLSLDNGDKYAIEVSNTIHNLYFANSQSNREPYPVRLYSSKLRRSVQTAIPIARKFNVPLILSKALAFVIPAVKRSGNKFEYQSIDEWRLQYPGVDFVDADTQESSFPSDNWISAIDHINQDQMFFNIIVGHRESIRGLAGMALQTPYCCIGVFDGNRIVEPEKNSKPTRKGSSSRPIPVTTSSNERKPVYRVLSVLDRFGNVIAGKE